MVAITKTVISITNTARKLVKNVAVRRIDLTKSSSNMEAVYKLGKETGGGYSKNIFKKAYSWLKTFVSTCKIFKDCIKENFASKSEKLGRKLKFNEKIQIIKDNANKALNDLKSVREEMNKLSELA